MDTRLKSEPTALAVSLPRISNFDFQAREDEAERKQRTIAAERCWSVANIPARHRDKVKQRHEATGPWADAYHRLRDLLPGGPLIVLLGKRGTGKTQMAVGLLADICREGRSVRYLKALDLFREIRECYRKDGPSEVAVVDKLCSYAGLVIDEAHERSDSDWENRTLTNIIDRRYDAMRTTILISNMTKEAFASAVGPSVVSRVHETGEVIVCDWQSFRTEVAS